MLYYEEVPSFEMPREIGPETTGNQFLSQYGCYDSLNNINELGLSQNPTYPVHGYYPQSSRGGQNNGQHSYVRNCPPYGSIPQVLPNNISTYPTTSPGNGHYMTQSLDGVSRELQHRPNLRSSPYSPNLESFYDIPNNYHHSKLNRMFNEDYVLNSPPRENSYPLSYPFSYGYAKLHGKLVDLDRVGYDTPEQNPLMVKFCCFATEAFFSRMVHCTPAAGSSVCKTTIRPPSWFFSNSLTTPDTSIALFRYFASAAFSSAAYSVERAGAATAIPLRLPPLGGA